MSSIRLDTGDFRIPHTPWMVADALKHSHGVFLLEAPPGIEPGVMVLWIFALLGRTCGASGNTKNTPLGVFLLEAPPGIEPGGEGFADFCPAWADMWRENKKGTSKRGVFVLEAPPGIEPGVKVLQTSALPLGYGAMCR